MDRQFQIINRRHDVKHYATLSFQTVLIYVVFIAGLFSVPAAKLIAERISDMEIERGVIGETAVTLEIADNEVERLRGLSGLISIPQDHGMLFIFDKSSNHGIWMKDMNFPIDIIWLNEFSEVVHIEKKVSANTFPKVFESSKPAKYVLEFNAGFVSRHSIKLGDKFVLL